MDPEEKQLLDQVAALLADIDLSRSQLYDRCGISRTSFSEKSRGKHPWTREEVHAILDFYNEAADRIKRYLEFPPPGDHEMRIK